MQPNWHNVPIVTMLCCCVYRQCFLYTVSCTKVITRHQHVGSWINIVQKSGCGPTMSAVNTIAGGKVSLGLHSLLFWYSSSFNSLWVYRVLSSHELSVIVQTLNRNSYQHPVNLAWEMGYTASSETTLSTTVLLNGFLLTDASCHYMKVQ